LRSSKRKASHRIAPRNCGKESHNDNPNHIQPHPTTSNHIQPHPTTKNRNCKEMTMVIFGVINRCNRCNWCNHRIRRFEAAAIKFRAIPRASLAAKETTSPSTADQISGLRENDTRNTKEHHELKITHDISWYLKISQDISRWNLNSKLKDKSIKIQIKT
jgi:hypothetical protein